MKTTTVALCVVLSAASIFAQQPDKKAPLYQKVAALDKQFFDAYNHCDLETAAAMLSDNLEFYHDQSGLDTSKASVVEALKNNICGKVTRELVPGSLKVYPLKGYGAVEIGVHLFHHPGHDDTEPVGEGQFVQIWHDENGVWRLTRVISFDHHALKR
ncbi:MAG TPA: nuclear transport factor 2 family protein [Terriglobales bacterium]|nr:nuclear transport factor 2 family protein [Terriglobales bacterium]